MKPFVCSCWSLLLLDSQNACPDILSFLALPSQALPAPAQRRGSASFPPPKIRGAYLVTSPSKSGLPPLKPVGKIPVTDFSLVWLVYPSLDQPEGPCPLAHWKPPKQCLQQEGGASTRLREMKWGPQCMLPPTWKCPYRQALRDEGAGLLMISESNMNRPLPLPVWPLLWLPCLCFICFRHSGPFAGPRMH